MHSLAVSRHWRAHLETPATQAKIWSLRLVQRIQTGLNWRDTEASATNPLSELLVEQVTGTSHGTYPLEWRAQQTKFSQYQAANKNATSRLHKTAPWFCMTIQALLRKDSLS